MSIRTAVPAAVLLAIIAACTSDALITTDSPLSLQRGMSTLAPGGGEGELVGDMFINGAYITDTGYTVRLEAANPETSQRLHDYNASMWVSPTFHGGSYHMFAWIDPRHQGACGTEYQYVSGDTIHRGAEQHWVNAHTPPSATAKEKHCIQPGTYTLKIFHNGSLYKQFDVDYVPIMNAQGDRRVVYNANAGVDEAIEKYDYNDTSYLHHDLDIRIDIGNPGYVDTPVLYGDAAGGNPYAQGDFYDNGSLSGNHHTWFRFSSIASTTTESSAHQGRLLSRIFWDSAGNILDRSGFWDSHSWDGIIRVHQFMTDTLATRNYVVGLETLRPDEQPRTTPEVTRAILIEGPAPALSVVVEGPAQVSFSGYCTWTAVPSGGVSPFHYQWYYRRQGQSELPVGSDANSYTRFITVEPTGYVVWIRAVVTDAAQKTAQDIQLVEVGGGARPIPLRRICG